jgi:hypothetical protein
MGRVFMIEHKTRPNLLRKGGSTFSLSLFGSGVVIAQAMTPGRDMSESEKKIPFVKKLKDENMTGATFKPEVKWDKLGTQFEPVG